MAITIARIEMNTRLILCDSRSKINLTVNRTKYSRSRPEYCKFIVHFGRPILHATVNIREAIVRALYYVQKQAVGANFEIQQPSDIPNTINFSHQSSGKSELQRQWTN